MSKTIKKIISSFLILIVLVGTIPVHADTKGDLIDPVNFIGDDTTNGGVKLTKTVSVVDKEQGIYNVKFDISSKDSVKSNSVTNPLYAVIVFDTSGSMCESFKHDCGDKWQNATEGAISFSKELLKNVEGANIALVTFANNAKVAREFDNKELKNVDFNEPNGGTNMAKGLQEAFTLLNNVKEENAKKFVILMSDGEPQVYTNIFTDYIARKEASDEATNIKNNNIELFAVGYDTTESNAEFLKTLVTSPDSKYYSSGKIDDIATKFNNIVSNISKFPAGIDVTIKDVIGDNFNYVDKSATNGVIADNNTVTYKIDKLSEEEDITFNFNIQVKDNIKTGWHDTNHSASISYTDSLGENKKLELEKSSKVYWEIPKYDYVINYYKDEISKDNLIDSIKGNDEYDKEITVDTTYKLPEGYYYKGEEIKFNIKEEGNVINVVYSIKDNLSYCVNYFYDGIIDINATECYYDQTYGKEITSFIDKPKEGYVFDNFEPIVILDQEENIMNVYYKKVESGEIVPPKTGVESSFDRVNFVSLSSLLLLGIYSVKKYINV